MKYLTKSVEEDKIHEQNENGERWAKGTVEISGEFRLVLTATIPFPKA